MLRPRSGLARTSAQPPMRQILDIFNILTDALVLCGVVMSIRLIILWILHVLETRPPDS